MLVFTASATIADAVAPETTVQSWTRQAQDSRQLDTDH